MPARKKESKDANKPKAVFAKSPGLRRGESRDDLLSRFLAECARHAYGNEACILETDHIEGVHQMRVGLRRLRACLSLFEPLVQEEGVGIAHDWISPLLDALGPARDWDVFIRDRFDRFKPERSDPHSLELLRKAAEAKRSSAYATLRNLMKTSEAYRAKHALINWIARRGWREDTPKGKLKSLESPAVVFARDSLHETRRRALKKGRNLSELPPRKLHKLRIAIKKHRYPVDFFANSFEGRQGKKYTAALKTLQTELGRVNDVSVAGALIDELSLSTELQPAVDLLMERAQADHDASMTRLHDHWRDFKGLTTFWKNRIRSAKDQE